MQLTTQAKWEAICDVITLYQFYTQYTTVSAVHIATKTIEETISVILSIANYSY